MNLLPNPPLKTLLTENCSPCRFYGQCKAAQWNPGSGHIPQGFVGATGTPEDVELVMVFSEPGHPHDAERYDASPGAEGLMKTSVGHA